MRRCAWVLGVILVATTALPVNAAMGFANAAFQARWQAGERLVPNFWGPLMLAKEGQQEDYAEAAGGRRLVQYFDKGRMELGGDGTVTSGLLARELFEGRIQTGNGTFVTKSPSTIPVVGDPRATGGTYATLQGIAGDARRDEERATGGTPNFLGIFSRDAQMGMEQERMGDMLYEAQKASLDYAGYDDVTRKNIGKAFADYRDRVGFETVGYAISVTIFEVVPVSGRPTPIVYQFFERRVLSFNASNPPESRVEMGNAGQHYFQWRYATA